MGENDDAAQAFAQCGKTMANLSRMEMHRMRQRWGILREHPELRAEAIADHHMRCFDTATLLKASLNMRKMGAFSEELDELISRLVEEISKDFRESFGIELEWEECE